MPKSKRSESILDIPLPGDSPRDYYSEPAGVKKISTRNIDRVGQITQVIQVDGFEEDYEIDPKQLARSDVEMAREAARLIDYLVRSDIVVQLSRCNDCGDTFDSEADLIENDECRLPEDQE